MSKSEYITKIRREIPEAKSFSDADICLHYEMVYQTDNVRDMYNNQDLWIAIMKHKKGGDIN